jgi:TnpA family transposase
LRDFPDRRLASIEPPTRYGERLQPLFGRPIKTDVIGAQWDNIVRLVASQHAGVVAPSVMMKKLAAYPRQNKLPPRCLGWVEPTWGCTEGVGYPAAGVSWFG